jgi:hypothetical protein
MDKSNLKKGLLELVAYLKEMAIIHEEHSHVIDHEKAGDFGTHNMSNVSDAGVRSSEHSPGGSLSGVSSDKTPDRDRTKLGTGRSSDWSGTGKQSTRKPPPCLNTNKRRGLKALFV